MAAQEFPLLNGTAPSWADVSIKMAVYEGETVETADIAGIDFSDTLEMGVVRGTGGQKRKRTTGQEDCEGSLKLYRDGFVKFMRALKQVAPTRAGQKQVGLSVFDVYIYHTPPGDSEVHEIQLLGCRIAGRTFSMAEGTDADQVEVPLNIMKIVHVDEGDQLVLL